MRVRITFTTNGETAAYYIRRTRRRGNRFFSFRRRQLHCRSKQKIFDRVKCYFLSPSPLRDCFLKCAIGKSLQAIGPPVVSRARTISGRGRGSVQIIITERLSAVAPALIVAGRPTEIVYCLDNRAAPVNGP